MKKFNAKGAMTATGLIAASLALSGCQAIFGPSTASRGETQNVDMGDYFEGRLAVGRYYLEKGITTKAVIAFRQASHDPRYAGEAYNGMAIAYDRLGRTDLAHRYFNMAVAAAPKDDRFSRNLARLENRIPVMPDIQTEAQQVEMAQLELPELPAVEAEAELEKRGSITIGAQPAKGVVVASKPATEAVRVSRGEVRVAPAVAPVKPVPVRTAVRVERRSQSRAVIARARRNAQARRGYPIRLVYNDNRATFASQD